ncbi:unnamed protein product, partial [Lymnaea stagnalis]
LTEIPGRLSPDITFLNLSNNAIASIPNGAFLPYSKLNILILEANNLSDLHPDSFVGLENLKYLNLRNNHLKMPDAFPKGVFRPLTSLMYLNIQMNNRWGMATDAAYPETELVHLGSLRVLCIDGLSNQTFGEGFRNMTSLRSLVMSGFDGLCDLATVRNGTFEHLGQITTLVISNCSIHPNSLPDDIFVPLTRLFSLDIQDNHKMGFISLKRVMSPLKNSNLRFLFANAIISRYSLAITVNTPLVEMLPKSLVYLEARENCFESVDPEIFPKLPKLLRYLDVGNNRLIFGDYLQNLTWMKNLQTLMLNGETFLTNIPRRFEHMDGFTGLPQLKGTEVGDVGRNTEIANLVLHLPPMLPKCSQANLDDFFSSFKLCSVNNSLRYIDVGENYFPNIKGPFTGLQKLEHLDLSLSFVQHFGREYFKNFPSLTSLFLDNNLLNKYLNNVYPGNVTVLGYLRNLTFLELSYNRITSLPYNVFEGLDKLQYLYLDGNLMRNFDVEISHMKSLALLSMRSGGFTTLPGHVRQHIDSLEGVFVDLAFNAIHCDCHNIDFLRWMVKSKAFDATFQNYSCVYPDSSSKYIHDAYEQDLRLLEKQCAQNYPIFLAVTGSTLLILGVITFGIVYRFRWKLRYLYYAAYLRLKSADQQEQSEQYRYDVFVSYTYKDEQFVLSELMPELRNRGLRLLVHGRDFVAGDFIASNIVTAVKESRKTLVVLTRNLLASTWCNYELQMSNKESVHTGRQILVFLLKESISTRELGAELTYHIRNSTYIMDPRSEGVVEEAVVEQFWSKLAMDLKR